MATRSTIAMEHADGTIRSVYCHWDGYPAHVGKILNEHYIDQSKIKKLLDLGDISSLREDIGEQHDFDNPTKGWTLAYGRDRGESDVGPLIHESSEQWLDSRKGNGCEYGYLWDGICWTTFKI